MFKYIPIALLALGNPMAAQQTSPAAVNSQTQCQGLLNLRQMTITRAELRSAVESTPAHCYVQGVIDSRIRFHMQLPLPEDWNGRLVNIGDGGKDGQLDFSVEFSVNRLRQGYAVANSNSGHDSAAEPRATFADQDIAAVIDFGYRAVHLTANASKFIARSYYGRAPAYTYFEGCSTGGRQGLMEAQRYPDDFDGIVVGAPVFDYQRLNVSHVWYAQRVFADNFAGNLAFDKDGDGTPESLTKWQILRDSVVAKCDAIDGIRDGVIDDPPSCKFDPAGDLAARMCPAGANRDDCFTPRQIQLIQEIYRGPRDSKGVQIYKGMDLGSEWRWNQSLIAHRGNNMVPSKLIYGVDHVNFLFYEHSPGVPVPNAFDIRQEPDKKANPPEFAWWEFNVDDVTAGKGEFMMSITDATNPDLSRFLNRKNGKLLIYHGWADPEGQAQPTLDYYKQVVQTTFNGDLSTARQKTRLFLVPGMGHCGDGPGCSQWDRLAPLVNWVEKGAAPDYLVAEHETNGRTDNQRRVCAYPQRAVYAGPAGGQSGPVNWVERNFVCR